MWTDIFAESSSTSGNDGNFTTIINSVTYDNVINRTYSYPGVTPSITLVGTINGEKKIFFLTLLIVLWKKDNVYLLNVKMKGDVSKPVTITVDYQMVNMGKRKYQCS